MVENTTETALIPAKQTLDLFVKDTELPILRLAERMTTLNWREMQPPEMALLLMQKPFPVSGGTYNLTFRQALFFATRCFELGVSPFSSEVWFDPNRWAVNLTLEGKRTVAHNKGIELGPPSFEEGSRKWEDVPRVTEISAAVKLQFTKDISIKCRMRVGPKHDNEYAEYIAWLSEWYVPKSPVWQAKPIHMLQIRAQEKALTICLGVGASAMPDERDLD